jgi:outer membrane immunogenic protein
MRIIATVLAAVAVSTAAMAADLPQAPPPPMAPAAYVPIVAPVYNWGGIYIGINGGYGFGTAKWTVSSQPSNTVNPNGGVVGGTLGANWQSGALVLGVEGDFDWSGITNSSASTVCGATGNCQTGNTWLSTLRGRIGYAADRVLFYGTGGGVFGNIQTVTAGVTNTTSKVGWTAGVGVEVAFADNWTAKVEYLYANLGTGSITCTTACGVAAPGIPVSVGLIDNLVRAGINYKFNF